MATGIRANRKAERVALARQLLNARWRKGRIKEAMNAKYGLAPRTCEKYLKLARDQLVSESGQSQLEHKADAYGFYISVIEDDKSTVREKLVAQERIDKLMGLECPTQYEMEVSNTAVRVIEMPDNQREPNLIDNLSKARTHEGNGNGRPRTD